MKKWISIGLAAAVLLPMAAMGDTAAKSSTAINYMALENPYFNYSDLTLAKAHDFSDRKIARVVKIAEKSGSHFSDISDALMRGETFVMICNHYNVSLASLDHVRKQEDQVANYLSAYETTGKYAFPHNGQ